MTVIIELAGEPVAKGRPRFAMRGEGQRPIAYTPGKTRSYEAMLRHAAQVVMEGKPLINGPLAMIIYAFVSIPVSWSNKKQQQAIDQKIFPTVRPDLDNYEKAAMDACECVVYPNDSQVVVKHAMKLYSDKPLLRIKVFTMDEYLEMAT